MQFQGLPGFRDFYPDDLVFRNHILGVWRDVATRYGFEEYDGPPLEPLELYTQKSGDEIVSQLYEFRDRGGRQVALRPEMTPTLARMVAARAGALKKPIRWFSIPQLFRYERQQRGRLREHFQFNMDLIGESGPLADAEIIAAAIDVTRMLGLGPSEVRARVSDRRIVRALLCAAGVPEHGLLPAYAAIDKIGRAPRSDLVKDLGLALGVGERSELPERVLSVGEIRGLESVKERLADEGDLAEVTEPLADCVEALRQMELGAFVDVDLSVVRGLAYYTGVVFELFDAGASLRAICGGGRYDGLLGTLGGAELPAVGFGMGDVVLGELLRDRGRGPTPEPRLDAFLVAVTSEDLAFVLRLAHQLRDRGVRVEFSLKQQSMTKQLRTAAARPARRAVIVGPDERAVGEALVRDLDTGSEERIAFGALVQDYVWT
jgi:histidyl-tRNA synthetase